LADTDYLNSLAEALNDLDPQVRKFEAESLGKFGDKHVARLLIATVETDSNSDVRIAAIRALGELKSSDSV